MPTIYKLVDKIYDEQTNASAFDVPGREGYRGDKNLVNYRPEILNFDKTRFEYENDGTLEEDSLKNQAIAYFENGAHNAFDLGVIAGGMLSAPVRYPLVAALTLLNPLVWLAALGYAGYQKLNNASQTDHDISFGWHVLNFVNDAIELLHKSLNRFFTGLFGAIFGAIVGAAQLVLGVPLLIVYGAYRLFKHFFGPGEPGADADQNENQSLLVENSEEIPKPKEEREKNLHQRHTFNASSEGTEADENTDADENTGKVNSTKVPLMQ